MKVWFRADGHRYAAQVDEFDNPVGRGRCDVSIHEMKVIRETPKGVWVDAYGVPRFVLREARKRYASPSREEALRSFIARKSRQTKILRAQLETTEELREIAEGMLSGERDVAAIMGRFVNHKDGDPKNNEISNLEIKESR